MSCDALPHFMASVLRFELVRASSLVQHSETLCSYGRKQATQQFPSLKFLLHAQDRLPGNVRI
jgi:hypothetical protein